MLTLPPAQNFRDSRACLLPSGDVAEHRMKQAVPAVMLVSSQSDQGRNSHQSRIPESEHIGPFHHQDRCRLPVVSMYDHIGESLTECDIHRRILMSNAATDFERCFQISYQFRVNFSVKIIEIARPSAIESHQIHLTSFGLCLRTLLKIKRVTGRISPESQGVFRTSKILPR